MAFFGNSAVNRVNLHYAIQALAMATGGVFFLVFLLHAGVSVPVALLSQAAILAGRFAMRPALLPIAKRWGLKPLLIAGTLGVAAQYPLLAQVHGIGVGLVVLCFVASIGDVLYWSSYHAYFAALGDAEHRGHQIGAREALAAIVGIAGPLIGGWALVMAGPYWTFWAVGLVQALSALPLLGAPNVAIKPEAPGALRSARLGVILFLTDGWLGGCYYYIWLIALFVSLHESFSAYGGAMALSALVGADGGMLLGRNIDGGDGKRSVLIAYGVVAAAVLMRAASAAHPGLPWLAVAANAPGAVVAALQATAMMSVVYNMAKASPCPLRFHMATEGGWDVGCAAACLIAAGLSALGQSLAIAILLALPVLSVTVLMLRRYHHGQLVSAPLDA